MGLSRDETPDRCPCDRWRPARGPVNSSAHCTTLDRHDTVDDMDERTTPPERDTTQDMPTYDWFEVCDLAMCAPDTRYTPQELVDRAARWGNALTIERVETALRVFSDRPRGAEHSVGRVRL